MSILNLAWLIPLFPFLAFVAIALFTYRDRKLSHQLAIGGIAIAFVLSQVVFWAAVLHPVGGGEHAFESPLIRWLPIGREVFSLGVYVDPATTVMVFMVPLVCLMIFIYSVGHMHGDSRYSRFFAYISLLASGMLGLVVFNNLLAFFICWEIMSTCTALLIGFRHEEKPAYQAALKAFLMTKVGDLFFMLGLVLLYAEVGSLAYRDIFNPATLEHLALTPTMIISGLPSTTAKSGKVRTMRNTPAVSTVAAWMRAEAAVGATMASGNQTCSGNWALLPTVPPKSSSTMTFATDSCDPRKGVRAREKRNSVRLRMRQAN